ncbi:MAG: hypothetical protein ABW007_07830 [Chitinophagaceae bacterium]
MYFNNLLKLCSYYLKNHIPQDKHILQEYIECSEDKDTPKHALHWLDLMNIKQDNHSYKLQQHINLLANLLSINLSIDAWYSGVAFKDIENHNYIEFLSKILQQKNIIITEILSENHYHILQNELFTFSKALLYFLMDKKYVSDYQEQQFTEWLEIK